MRVCIFDALRTPVHEDISNKQSLIEFVASKCVAAASAAAVAHAPTRRAPACRIPGTDFRARVLAAEKERDAKIVSRPPAVR